MKDRKSYRTAAKVAATFSPTARVLAALKTCPAEWVSRHRIAEATGLSSNRVAGSLGFLAAAGFVRLAPNSHKGPARLAPRNVQ